MLRRWLMRLILAYRRNRSAGITRISMQCIYHPTCSKYALVALHRHGLLHGGRLGWTRLTRCRADKYEGGHDPVPPKTTQQEE